MYQTRKEGIRTMDPPRTLPWSTRLSYWLLIERIRLWVFLSMLIPFSKKLTSSPVQSFGEISFFLRSICLLEHSRHPSYEVMQVSYVGLITFSSLPTSNPVQASGVISLFTKAYTIALHLVKLDGRINLIWRVRGKRLLPQSQPSTPCNLGKSNIYGSLNSHHCD